MRLIGAFGGCGNRTATLRALHANYGLARRSTQAIRIRLRQPETAAASVRATLEHQPDASTNAPRVEPLLRYAEIRSGDIRDPQCDALIPGIERIQEDADRSEA